MDAAEGDVDEPILQPGTPDSIAAVLPGSGLRVLDLREGLDLSDARRSR